MSAIAPNSDVYFYKDLPLDPDYENTFYFADNNARLDYFFGSGPSALIPVHIGDMMYQRRDRGYMRVGLPYSTMYDVNYMIFKNTSFENKLWYAFVDNVEYINNEVTEIHYTLDVLQSWLFDITLEQCFVERQHSITDDIGDNIVPEDVDPGEYVYAKYTGKYEELSNYFEELYVVIGVCDSEATVVNGKTYGGIYSGATYYAFPYSTAQEIQVIQNFLDDFIQKPDAIVAMFLCPADLVRVRGTSFPDPNLNFPQAYIVPIGADPPRYEIALSALNGTEDMDGYYPKNKKLYTFPYNMLQIDNGQGNVARYRYEYFKNGTPVFMSSGCVMMPVSVRLCPIGYKNAGNRADNLNPARWLQNENIELTNYPMCSWNMDTYKAWLSQNAVPMLLDITTSMIPISTEATGINAASNVHRFFSGNIHGNKTLRMKESYSENESNYNNTSESFSVNRPLNVVTDIIKSGYKASIAADMMQGTISSGSAVLAMGNMKFYSGRMCCRGEYAKMIDDYFTMFGYADKTVHVPNIHARQRWTYVKTNQCQVTGNLPADDKIKIQEIFDNGIRFWADIANFGKFNMTNPVLT